MINTAKYNSLPARLQEWVDTAAALVQSPLRRDEVRKNLSEKILNYYEQHACSEDATLAFLGDSSIEAEKNQQINQLPELFEWKWWRNIAFALFIFSGICAVGVVMTYSAARAAFHKTDPALVSHISIGRAGGGSTPGGMLVMLVVFLLLAIVLLSKAAKKRKETERLYAAFYRENPFSEFGKQ